MSMSRTWSPRLGLLAVALGLGTACSKAPKPEAKADAKVEAKAEDKSEAKAEAKSAGGPAEEAKGDLGARFRDPDWFRKDAFPGAKVVKFGRTETNAEGLFASQILFEWDGTDVNDCVEKVRGLVEPHVPGLQPTEGADGRITLRGATDRMDVTLVCGAVEGKTKAYVGYRWLK